MSEIEERYDGDEMVREIAGDAGRCGVTGDLVGLATAFSATGAGGLLAVGLLLGACVILAVGVLKPVDCGALLGGCLLVEACGLRCLIGWRFAR